MSSPRLLAGSFSILRNGAALPINMIAAIRDVRVEHEINAPGMFSFTLSMLSPSGSWQGADLDIFAPGDDITVMLGATTLKRLIVGEITAIEPRFSTYSTATIRGFDRLYRMQFGKTTRVFHNLGDDAIAQEVARASGVTMRTEGRVAKVDAFVRQHNLSNYDFLLGRCGPINFELVVDGTTVVFRPSAEGAAPVRALEFPRDLISVDLDLRVPTAGSKVTAHGFNFQTNQLITAESRTGTRRDLMGGEKTGYQLSGDLPASAIVVERPDVGDVTALQAIADARYQTELKRFIQGSASLNGDPDIVAGVNLKLSGLSDRFDGIYYVVSSTHTYSEDNGYTTDVKLRRTGA